MPGRRESSRGLPVRGAASFVAGGYTRVVGARQRRGRDGGLARRFTGRVLHPMPMPTVSHETAVAFQELFRRYAGQQISESQARDHAENLIRLVNFVLEREPRE